MTSAPAIEHSRHPAQPVGPRTLALDHIPAVTVERLLSALSLALDLAEGRETGHALRVSYISASLAGALGLPRAQRVAAGFAGLLHDAGVPHASESLTDLARTQDHQVFSGSPLHAPGVLAARFHREHVATIVDALHEHTFEGATAVAALGFPPHVAEAVLCHHERHDGEGFPLGLAGNEVPQLARIVAVADYAESFLAAATNPLLARRNLENGLREQAGRAFHPQVVDALIAAARRDDFWIRYHDAEPSGLFITAVQDESDPMEAEEILRFVASFADIVDARSSHRRGNSRRVARHARALALAAGLPEAHARAVELAALLHDIGMLKVPSRILGKPEILTVDEMYLLHQHPRDTAEIVRAVPGWDAIADWTAAHHERLDGRGYPEGLAGEEIPFEARILAIADVYAALTASRPHRPALTQAEALAVMRRMAATTIDPALFTAFEELGPATAERAG